VVVFDEKRATAVIDAIRPHIYAKGGDYTPESLNPEERAALERAGSEIRILSLVPGRSTSATLKKVNAGCEPGAKKKLRLAVFGSGKGSNFEAILRAIESGELDAEVKLVISDVEDSRILRLARERDFPAIRIEPGGKKPGQLGDAALKEIGDRLRAAEIDLVILAGFMRIIRAPLLDDFTGRILNIHPSLLPKFPGLHAWKQAIEAGEAESGCTVHLVNAQIDAGRILRQARVPIGEGDTPETLHARIQEQEHRLYPAVIAEYGASLRRP
jgi:formyltetrahydrofolate-dependent phosphoribosylglycinamide formyltransferase